MALDWKRYCWCGNTKLQGFSPDYAYCSQCGSLVSQKGLSAEEAEVQDDTTAFYGREYWFAHQTQDFGFPDIYQRARQDLPQRCLYWLRTLLSYKLPPANVLELGSAHGGFVALMRWAGFEGVGLELSPWVVEFAHQTFDISVLLGEVEKQQIQPESLDAIVLFDVLEHLDNPIATMEHCSSLLKQDGLFIIQMPNLEEGVSYSDMEAQKNPFLPMMTAVEHLYLFSHRSAKEFFERLGFKALQFESPFFPTDMFFVASREPLSKHTDEQISESLSKTASGRLIQALLDKDLEKKRDVDTLVKQLQEIKDDRAKASTLLEQYDRDLFVLASQLRETQTQKEQAFAQLHSLQTQLKTTQNQLSQYHNDVLTLQEELLRSQYQHQQTQSHLQQTQNELQQTQSQLEQTCNQLSNTHEKLKTSRAKTQQVRKKLKQSQDELSQVKAVIAAMESSKFWKLRTQWLKVKKLLGMSTKG